MCGVGSQALAHPCIPGRDDTPEWGGGKHPPKRGSKIGQKTPPKKGVENTPKKGSFLTPLGGWRYTKQCKFWRDSSVLIQGVRRFFALRRVIFGSFFDPPKRPPQTGGYPKMGVFDPPKGTPQTGVFSTPFLGSCRSLMDDATNLHRVAQVVNTTRRSNPGSSRGTRNPDGADHMVGRG